MKLALVTANLGSFDPAIDNVKQDLPSDVALTEVRITDKEFPPRKKSMTPRMQARIVKMHAWQFAPDQDIYLWVDSSCRLARLDSVVWFLEQLGDKDIAVFKHNRRNTIQEEADYLKERLELEAAGKKQKYVLDRYENELIDEQLAEIDPNGELYASTAFIFKDSQATRKAMKDWWYHTSRYHSIDQLSFTHAIKSLKINVIQQDYLKCPYLEYVRGKN